MIGINIPPEILGRGGLEYASRKSGLIKHAKQLVLEITERGVPDRLGLEALSSVPSTGARVALDDTTLSGANLALLTRCNFDFVKIDSGLVAQLAPDLPRPEWLAGLTALFDKTSLQTIAEGVETEVQARILRDSGVQYAQGHHSLPVVIEESGNAAVLRAPSCKAVCVHTSPAQAGRVFGMTKPRLAVGYHLQHDFETASEIERNR